MQRFSECTGQGAGAVSAGRLSHDFFPVLYLVHNFSVSGLRLWNKSPKTGLSA
ncbi:hypothetical protein EDF73_11047 [Raoultella sp. BIGb0138]|nr:hypothetical protein EDF73_11047 [Raoultella sp. BIGb0138]